MFDFLKKKISSWIGKSKEEPKKKEEKKPKVSKGKRSKVREKVTEEKIESEQPEEQEKEIREKTEKPVEEKKILIEGQTEEKTEEKSNFFTKLFKKITTSKLSQNDFDEIFAEFEMTLLENNVALEAVDKIKENLSLSLVGQQIKKAEAEGKILNALKEAILSVLTEPPNLIEKIREHEGIYTIIFFGINGTGKTTSIAKIAYLLKKNNISCVLAAADTFRAASIEQLKAHADKLKVPIVSSSYNADPASVAFDAKKYAEAHKIKVVLIDTAGRMYTKANLLKEMEKIIRVAQPDMKIFVGESITGNDVLEQCKTFNEAIGIDGVILSKADVDEKAGTILSVSHITKKPIYFLGVGQELKDLAEFKKEFVLKNLGLE